MSGKFVAIKMHFGELGNIAYLRPNYAKAVADLIKELGGIPFLTDCNTLYPGSRKNAIEHLYCAWENGFTPLSAGCPVIIADGLKGTDDVEVPVEGGEYVKSAKIGRAIMDADVFISLSHFKGHEMTGFGGAIKNIGMGCGSRAGKKEQHSNGKASIDEAACRGCRQCLKECANDALHFDAEARKMRINQDNCVGCGRCVGALQLRRHLLCQRRRHLRAQLPHGRVHQGGGWTAGPSSTSRWCWTSPPTATATPKTTPRSCRTSACSAPPTRWPWTRPVWTPASRPSRCRTASSATT